MKIITVTLISESHCAYEKPSDSFYEVWSTDGRVYRIDDGKIYPPLELTGGRRIVDTGDIGRCVAVSNPWLILRWFDGVEIQWPVLHIRDVDPILRIRMYCIQPTTLHCNKHDHIIQGVGDISIFQSTKSGNQTFMCNSEMKWIPSHIIDPIHECLSIVIDGPVPGDRERVVPGDHNPSVYWNDKLRSIWDNYLEPTMKNVISNGDRQLNTLIPLSVAIEGIPCSHDRGTANTFKICKGLSCQSFWYLSPGIRIVTDEWIQYHLTTILRLHGSTIDEFCNGPIDHIACNDAMKLATIHVTTWPFILDRRFGYSTVSGQLEQYDIDKFDCSTKFGGDCEDGAMFVVKLIHSILGRVSGPSYVMKLRSCYAFLGIPVGLSGQSKGGDATANHMYGAMIPYPLFTGLNVNEDEINKKFNIKGSNQTITLIETTMMTSFQYSNHETVSDVKRNAFKSIHSLHIDDDCLWNNYTLLMPLSFQKEYGSWRHERMNRIFTFSHCLFDDKTDKIQGTFVINNGKGALAKDFFNSSFKLSLPPIRMTPRVFNDEMEIIKTFECPITPLEPVVDPMGGGGTVGDHINVYCWKRNENTPSIINKIKKKLRIKSNPTMFPYGHGVMIQFKLTTQE